MTPHNGSVLAHLPPRCPHCGKPLRYLARNTDNEHVYTCLRDGWFIFTRKDGLERLRPKKAT